MLSRLAKPSLTHPMGRGNLLTTSSQRKRQASRSDDPLLHAGDRVSRVTYVEGGYNMKRMNFVAKAMLAGLLLLSIGTALAGPVVLNSAINNGQVTINGTGFVTPPLLCN
jgi:hypothetical protein